MLNNEPIELPKPRLKSNISLEHTLQHRRSVREFSPKSISLAELSQLLWAAQGITDPQGLRTSPSAGALYPLEVYAVVGNVDGLAPAVYRYLIGDHQLIKHVEGDLRADFARGALHQDWLKQGAVLLVFTAVAARTTNKYDQRGMRYIHMEAGHAAQNLFLQAIGMDLRGAVVGAFDDKTLNKLLKAAKGETVLYLMPVGRP